MLDAHSHILPAMDDGSSSADISLALLHEAAKQGVTAIAATSHYYPDMEYPEQYLERRADAYNRLTAALEANADTEIPKILLGAEVAFYDGISRSEGIKALCYENTGLLLLELPCRKWSDSVVHEVLQLPYTLGIQPVIAHIDRYMMFQKRSTLRTLLEEGVIIQANAEFFIQRSTQRKALRMLNAGQIHLLGTDCHNLSDRAPNMAAALHIIGEKLGEGAIRDLDAASRSLFHI